MSFNRFIYYCAVCGAWAALFVWFISRAAGILTIASPYTRTALIAAILGIFVAGAVGALDALLNATGSQRMVRVLLCVAIGAVGGFVMGLVGEFLHTKLGLPDFLGWILVGVIIGASIGVFDLIRAAGAGQGMGMAIRKTLNGVVGGCLGGVIGGLIFQALASEKLRDVLPRSGLAIGLVILGLCIGLLIGLAQVILKEAWVKVEAGFRAGREIMLSKEETLIGRAEGCDIGLFGDNGVERQHARIQMKNNRYVLADVGDPGRTYLNDEPLDRPTPLRSGDTIRVGNSVLRFGERQKRK